MGDFIWCGTLIRLSAGVLTDGSEGADSFDEHG